MLGWITRACSALAAAVCLFGAGSAGAATVFELSGDQLPEGGQPSIENWGAPIDGYVQITMEWSGFNLGPLRRASRIT